MPKQKLRIIPLGGLGEIGKNMTVLEYGDDIVVIDCGVKFPEANMPSVDLIIPDITYLLERKHKVRAFFITHGHEDHIGALPYVLPHFEVPVYATALTAGLISVKLKEHKLLTQSDIRRVKYGEKVRAGSFTVEMFSVAHSVPDAAGLAIRTPIGTVVHTGDFKIDLTPVDTPPTDIAALGRLGTEGVQVLLADSTGAERPGFSPSESTIGPAFDEIFRNAPGRILVATFASLIARIQQVITYSAKYDRRVATVGRSMQRNVDMALEMGYLTDPSKVIQPLEAMRKLDARNVTIVTTGAQGEPTSGLSRMANRDHRQVHIHKGDTVVMSSAPIPGNEVAVSRNIDHLFELGANVIYGPGAGVHVSGHPGQEELKMLTSITSPRFLVPVHGEARHLILHARLAESIGVPAQNILIPEIGRTMEFTENSARFGDRVPSGSVLIDRLGSGKLGDVVLRDRNELSRDGVLIAVITIDSRTGRPTGRPEMVSRGFVDERNGQMIDGARDHLYQALQHLHAGGPAEPAYIQSRAREALQRYVDRESKGRPMLLPIVIEV